jgi:uncharacterized membrane protein YfcA
MLLTFGCRYFRRAFGWCVPIGALSGLVGLGGGEFRLPVLMHSVGFNAKSAVPVNLAVSLVTLAFALITRSSTLSLADVVPHAAAVTGLACGGMVAAFYGAPLIQALSSERLVQIIAILLAAIGALLWAEALFPFSKLELVPSDPAVLFVNGCIIGGGIGLVSSVLGVAGGELLIPALIFVFSADIRTAGSASILVSLCLTGVGLWRYWRMGAFPRGRGIQRITSAMSFGSILGAGLGGLAVAIAPIGTLKLLLGGVLIAAAGKTLLTQSTQLR